MARLGEVIGFLLISVIASKVLQILIVTGYFRHILNHSPGPCKVIRANGSEDIAVLPDGLVFISSGLIYKVGLSYDPKLDQRESKLLTFNMNKPDNDPVELTLKQFNRTGFNPHGMSIYQNPATGVTSVFVVNHRPDDQAIEIFDFERASHSLVHRRSVVDKLIHSPNNLQAVGPDSFYVTNDNFFHFDSVLPRAVSMGVFAGVLRTNIIYFDGFKATVAAADTYPQNGIAMDTQGRFVFVGIGSAVNVFRRQKDQTLMFSQAINVGSFVDNINVDPVTGDLWLAGIPKVLDLLPHSYDVSHNCSSQVITIHLGQASKSGIAFPDHTIREVYANDGTEVSMATVAAVYQGRMLVGSLFGNLLHCEVKTHQFT